jgi:hypothetical protein
MQIYASRVKLKKVLFNKGSSANRRQLERNVQCDRRKNVLHAEKLFDTKSNGFWCRRLPLSLRLPAKSTKGETKIYFSKFTFAALFKFRSNKIKIICFVSFY